MRGDLDTPAEEVGPFEEGRAALKKYKKSSVAIARAWSRAAVDAQTARGKLAANDPELLQTTKLLLSSLFTKTGAGSDEHMRDDLWQEAFIALTDALHNYTEDKVFSLVSYVSERVKKRVRTMLEHDKGQRIERTGHERRLRELSQNGEPAWTPTAEEKERTAIVSRVLRKVPLVRAEILRYSLGLEGYPELADREIGEKKGKTSQWANDLFQRTVKRLGEYQRQPLADVVPSSLDAAWYECDEQRQLAKAAVELEMAFRRQRFLNIIMENPSRIRQRAISKRLPAVPAQPERRLENTPKRSFDVPWKTLHPLSARKVLKTLAADLGWPEEKHEALRKLLGRARLENMPQWQNDPDAVFVSSCMRYWNFAHAGDALRNDPVLVQHIVRQNGFVLEHAGAAFQNDPDIVLAAVTSNGCAIQYANERFKKSKPHVLAAVRDNGYALKYVDASFARDRDVVMAMMMSAWPYLRGIDAKFSHDREVVMAGARNGVPGILAYASQHLRFDREIVLTAVQNEGQNLRDAPLKFLLDPEILLAAVCSDGTALANVPEPFSLDKRFALSAVDNTPRAYLHVHPSLKTNPDILQATVRHGGDALQYIPHEYQTYEIVYSCVSRMGSALRYAADRFRRDDEIARMAVSRSKRVAKNMGLADSLSDPVAAQKRLEEQMLDRKRTEGREEACPVGGDAQRP